jgi:hypothetical protein
MIGMLAPAMWLVPAFSTGLLRAALRQMLRLGHGQEISNGVSFLAVISAILSVFMIAGCVRRRVKEYTGLGKSLRTFAVSFGIVAVYYGILVFCFWQMIPGVPGRN